MWMIAARLVSCISYGLTYGMTLSLQFVKNEWKAIHLAANKQTKNECVFLCYLCCPCYSIGKVVMTAGCIILTCHGALPKDSSWLSSAFFLQISVHTAGTQRRQVLRHHVDVLSQPTQWALLQLTPAVLYGILHITRAQWILTHLFSTVVPSDLFLLKICIQAWEGIILLNSFIFHFITNYLLHSWKYMTPFLFIYCI